MKWIATNEDKPVVEIEAVVGVVVVRVEPPTVVIVIDVEHVQIAVRVG